jgi:hypothetical protein
MGLLGRGLRVGGRSCEFLSHELVGVGIVAKCGIGVGRGRNGTRKRMGWFR